MTDKYKFKDKSWNVFHNDGRHLGKVSVNADDVREAYNSDKSMKPSTHEDEILSNQVGKFLFNNKLKTGDIQVTPEDSKPKRVNHKAKGGSSCW